MDKSEIIKSTAEPITAIDKALDGLMVDIPTDIEDDISSPDESELINDLNEAFHKKMQKQINDRDQKYTDLLKHYLSISRIRNWTKEVFKWVFFIALISTMIMVGLYEVKILKMICLSNDIDIVISAIPIFITAITGFVSTVIAIPLVITKYLFNSEEDKAITEIILHTQKHDMSGRQLLEHTVPNKDDD